MALLQLALIVRARRELTLSAGEIKRGEAGGSSFELTSEPVQTLDGPAFLKVGLAQTGSVNIMGAEVVNMDYLSDSLRMWWYLPSEQEPGDAQPVDLSQVGVSITTLERERPDPGYVWHFRVDGRGPYTETLFFDSGFMPPFKPTDIRLHLTDIGCYGYNSQILTKVIYGYKAPSFTQGSWGVPETIAQGTIDE
jgi:hypothetical protein